MNDERKAKVTVALDREVLRRVDAVAGARGDSRSSVIERMLCNGIGDEEKFLRAMENPVTRAVTQAVTSSPWLIEKIARLVGEEVCKGDGSEIREFVAKQAKRGAVRRGSGGKWQTGAAREGA